MTFPTVSYDEKHMLIAVSEGAEALLRGDYPVGAVLVIDGELVGKTNNALLSKKSWGDHAEMRLLLEHSQTIRERKTLDKDVCIELYSTLEPCLMCFGAAAMHRVTRVVFSLHDPSGGVTHIHNDMLPIFYKNNWPNIESSIFKEETFGMFYQFLERQTGHSWLVAKKLFEEMKATWK